MNAYPFSIFRRADRSCFSVAFNDENGKQMRPISTGKKTEKEAMQVAFKMLRDGISKKQNTVSVQDLSLQNIVRNVRSGTQAEAILDELRRLGWVKGFTVKGTEAAQDFIPFLKTFWDWDTSPYIEEKLRKSHGIHKRHCKQQGQAIKLYLGAVFQWAYPG